MGWLAAAICLGVAVLYWLAVRERRETEESESRAPDEGGTTHDSGSDAAERRREERQEGSPARHAPMTPDISAPGGGEVSSIAASYARTADLGELDDEGDEEITLLADLPRELMELQRGYRKRAPGSEMEISLGEELLMDGLLAEDLIDDEPTGPCPLIAIESAARTDRGIRRKLNEDSMLVIDGEMVFVVADGMGGHAAGERASKLTVEVIEKSFSSGRFDGEENLLWPRRGDELARTIEMANHQVFTQAANDRLLRGMGTTVTAIRFALNRKRAYIAHVGDSRCYRLRDGDLVQLTTDHTLANLLGATGPLAAQLARAVGVEAVVEVDLIVEEPEVGDLYLLCSDGLTKMVSEEEIRRYVDSSEDVSRCVDELVDEANRLGGKDNISVILLRVTEPN